MNGGLDHFASVIAGHLREWDTSPAFVELAIYGSDDASIIADVINSTCVQNLGAAVARGLFHQSSIGSITGVMLEDGRSVVIKAHQPERARQFLAGIVRIQSYLCEREVSQPRFLRVQSQSGEAWRSSNGSRTSEQRRMRTGQTLAAHWPEVSARSWKHVSTGWKRS